MEWTVLFAEDFAEWLDTLPEKLRRKILRYKPQVVAMVGVTVFRAMFPERKGAVKLGLQREKIGNSALFVLPNPSGRNANFTYAEMLAAFRALKRYTLSA